MSLDYMPLCIKSRCIMVTDYNINTLLELSGFQVKNCLPLFRPQVFPLSPGDSLSHSNSGLGFKIMRPTTCPNK